VIVSEHRNTYSVVTAYQDASDDRKWQLQRDKSSAALVRLTYLSLKQETQLMLTNRATRLEVSQGHQTRYHSIC